jgi:hypothetical protein
LLLFGGKIADFVRARFPVAASARMKHVSAVSSRARHGTQARGGRDNATHQVKRLTVQ